MSAGKCPETFQIVTHSFSLINWSVKKMIDFHVGRAIRSLSKRFEERLRC